MSSPIKVSFISTENGYLVFVPHDLKDAFKAVFKTTKFNSEEKAWEVGSRSLKKIEQFIADTAEHIAAINAQYAAEEEQDALNYDSHALQRELDKLQEASNKAKSDLKNVAELQAQLEQSRAAIKLSTQELEKVTQELQIEQAKALVQKTEIKELLASIVDVNRVIALKSVLENNHDPKNKIKKERFEQAQKEIKAMKDALEESGLKSIGINQMYYANINRPDRDSVRNIPDSAIYQITRVETE